MKKLSKQEQRTIGRHWLTLDEVQMLMPDWMLDSSELSANERYVMLCQLAGDYREGTIRRISTDRHEFLLDYGFSEMYWVGADDPAPLITRLAW